MTQRTASERKDVRAAEKASRIADAERLNVVRQIMSTTYGRAWLHDLLASTHVFHTSFTGEALSSAFAEGERSIGLRLLSDAMLAHPQNYLLMMGEANDRSASAEHTRSQDSDGRDQGPDDAPDADPGDDTTLILDYARA